ncbi:hypothetical protein GCM10010271_63750 [Streptomyces kurssanovii]|nr:hypothetical protein GCM10010271_63750 [Streptomyces kurssanovii]
MKGLNQTGDPATSRSSTASPTAVATVSTAIEAANIMSGRCQASQGGEDAEEDMDVPPGKL